MKILNELFLNFWAWWYYEALWEVIQRQREHLRAISRLTGFGVHLRYFFAPLYQDKSIIGRTISIFLRSIFVIFGGVVELVVLAFFVLILFLYLIFPILPVAKIWLNIVLD